MKPEYAFRFLISTIKFEAKYQNKAFQIRLFKEIYANEEQYEEIVSKTETELDQETMDYQINNDNIPGE